MEGAGVLEEKKSRGGAKARRNAKKGEEKKRVAEMRKTLRMQAQIQHRFSSRKRSGGQRSWPQKARAQNDKSALLDEERLGAAVTGVDGPGEDSYHRDDIYLDDKG